jgi:excisionase family DNA binding protein
MSSRPYSDPDLHRVQHDEPISAGHAAEAAVSVSPDDGSDDQTSGWLLTASEVAERLKVPTSWVYAETRAGRIPHVRLGPRYRRYRWEAIEQWVSELERGPVPYGNHQRRGGQPKASGF